MSANLSTGTVLAVCVLYAIKHRGADTPGMVLAACFGAVAGKSSLAPVLDAITGLIVGLAQAVIDAVNQFMSSRSSGGGSGVALPEVKAGLIMSGRTLIGR